MLLSEPKSDHGSSGLTRSVRHSNPRSLLGRLGRTLAAVSIVLAGLIATAPASHAAPGDTTVVCAFGGTPQGWATIGYTYKWDCGNYSGPNARTIKQLQGLPAGANEQVCIETFPTDWAIAGYVYSGSCTGNGYQNYNSYTLKNLAGLPVGTQVLVCANSPYPNGWATVYSTYTGACSGNGYSGNNAYYIRRNF